MAPNLPKPGPSQKPGSATTSVLASERLEYRNGRPAVSEADEKGAQMATYEAYCVKCRTKREFEGEKKELPNGRTAAQGVCPVCGTKVTRMLGKTA